MMDQRPSFGLVHTKAVALSLTVPVEPAMDAAAVVSPSLTI